MPRLHESTSLTSISIVRTSTARSSAAARTRSALDSLRTEPMTSYPAPASSRAVARPIPLLAPVTRTDLLTGAPIAVGACSERYGGRFLAMLEVPVTRLDPDVPPPSYAPPGRAGCGLVTPADATV